MKRPSLAVCCVTLVAAVLSVASMTGWGAADPTELPPPVQWMGADSHVTKARTVLVSEPAAWEKVYFENLGVEPGHTAVEASRLPEIDFARYAVVCVFGGSAINTSGIRLVSMAEFPDHHRLRYRTMGYQTFSMDGDDPGVKATPFGMFVIPRPTRTIVLEEDVNDLIGAPPVWKEQRRIEPPK